MTLSRMLLPQGELLRYRPECKVLFRRGLILVNLAAEHHDAIAGVRCADLAGARYHRTRCAAPSCSAGMGSGWAVFIAAPFPASSNWASRTQARRSMACRVG